MKRTILRLALPKGSLQESTLRLMQRAGFRVRPSSRAYAPGIDDEELEVRLIRAQEIPRYVAMGAMDFGITGRDWIAEAKVKVEEIGELVYAKQGLGRVRWVLAVPQEAKIRGVEDLEGKVIATEVVQITKSYLKRHKVSAKVEFSWGATEVKPPDLCDGIVELTETGRTLRANGLKIVDTVFESTTRVIMNSLAFQNEQKREKAENIVMLLQGALDAESKVGLKMNVPKEKLEQLVRVLPALRNPTIAQLYDPSFVALEVVVEEKRVRELLPKLKRLGAEGIIAYSLQKVIY